MNWRGFGKKRSWPISRYCHGIRFEGLRKTTKALIRLYGVPAEIRKLYLPNTDKREPTRSGFVGKNQSPIEPTSLGLEIKMFKDVYKQLVVSYNLSPM
jgi:hypothetical protein